MSCVEVVSIKNQSFAKDVAKELDIKLTTFDISNFADGELCIASPSNFKALGKKILLIHSFSFERSIDIQIFELLMFIGYLKQISNTEITWLSPYLPYSRQDKNSFNKKQLGLIEVFISLIHKAGASKIITCDIHTAGVIDKLKIKFENISLAPFWSKFINTNFKLSKDFILATPDKGGLKRVQEIAKNLNLNYVFIEKQRETNGKVKTVKLNGDVKNKNVILIDDIIDTGSTALGALNILKKNGADEVYGCFSHGVLAKDTKSKLEKSKFKEIFITNSIQEKNSKKSKKIHIVRINDYVLGFIKNIIKL